MIQTANIVEQDQHLREAAFYEKAFNFSYSGLKKLLDSPKEFYKEYVLQEKEVKRDKNLVLGTLTHFFTLEGVDFTEYFAVAPEGVPSGKGKDTVDEMFRIYQEMLKNGSVDPDLEYGLQDFDDEILKYMEEIDYYQNIKDTDKRLAKIYDQKLQDYFQFLLDSTESSKELVDSGMVDLASKKAEVIKNDEDLVELLGLEKEDSDTYRAYNEFEHSMELADYPFGLHGRIDNLTIDASTKTITVNDLKTTGGRLQEFPEAIKTWNYGLQCAVYFLLAQDCVKAFTDDSWTFKFNFVVIDKYNHVYAFPVSDTTMRIWEQELMKSLDQAKYHYTEKKYHLPYEFAKGAVEL